MSGNRGRLMVRQREMTRSIRAFKAAGFENVRVDVSRDGYSITSVNGGERQEPHPDTAKDAADVVAERLK
jgi:hypothetical protein